MLACFIVWQQVKHFGELLLPLNRMPRCGPDPPTGGLMFGGGVMPAIYEGGWPHNCNCSFRYLELQLLMLQLLP